MTNRQIRKRAWELFRGNYAGMLPAMIILGLTYIVSMVGNTASGPLKNYSGHLFTVLLAPVSLCGIATFCLDILHGGTPKTSLMFAHFRGIRRVLNIWIAALVVTAPLMLMNALISLMTSFGGTDSADATGMGVGLTLLVVALVLILSIVFIWLSLRLGIYGYAAALNPDARFTEWLGASFRAMRRNCWREIRLTITTGWPIVVILIIVYSIATSMGLTVRNSAPTFTKTIPTMMTSLIICFYQGYPLIALTLFAEDLLGIETGAKKNSNKQAIPAER